MMAKKMTLTIRLTEMEVFRLLVWELRQLADDMRTSADPFAERLEHAVDRFTEGPDHTEPDE